MITSLLSFIIRHFFASVVSVAIPVIFVTIVYFALLVVAVISNSGLGSPVALPFWVAVSFLTSIFYTAFLLFPSVVIAETISLPFGKWRHIAQVPISTLVLALLVFALTFIASLTLNHTAFNVRQWVNYSLMAMLVLAVPLGIYWWTMKLVQLVMSLPGTLLKQLGKRGFLQSVVVLLYNQIGSA